MTLPEHGSIADIEEFFAEHGLALAVHEDAPPMPSPEDLRRMNAEVREAASRQPERFWVDLRSATGSRSLRWYGSGESSEAAVRNARARWRIEQEGREQGPRRLP